MQEEPLRRPVVQKGEDIFSAPAILYLQHFKQLGLVPALLTYLRLFCLNTEMQEDSGRRFAIRGYFQERPCAINQTSLRAGERPMETRRKRSMDYFSQILPSLAIYKPLMQGSLLLLSAPRKEATATHPESSLG